MPAMDAVSVPEFGLAGGTWVRKVLRHFTAASPAVQSGPKTGCVDADHGSPRHGRFPR